MVYILFMTKHDPEQHKAKKAMFSLLYSTNYCMHMRRWSVAEKPRFEDHPIIRAAFVCVFVCFLSPLRSFGRSSPHLVGVCRWTSHLPLRGSFSKRSTGQRLTFTFHYIIYAPASRHTAAKGPFCFAVAAAESNSAPFAALHLDG